ncbi:unnamed protein product [Spirodela intermedia]|uniref:Uncharacterized protein n=1 Tax=Spirodela intermedia TaxID=51605 RepID=A0A7I8JEK3_SPIIN|nr:unnamed protein product [Spirodela intermedia]CAA6668557.1 unnamed protein product [Spirodela intermedia]
MVGGRAAAGDGHTAVLSGCTAAGDRWQRWSADERDEELRHVQNRAGKREEESRSKWAWTWPQNLL